MPIEEVLMKLNISFLIRDNKLLEKYNEIWNKVSNTIKNGFDSEFKINSHEEKIMK